MEILTQRSAFPSLESSIDPSSQVRPESVRRCAAIRFAVVSNLTEFEALRPEWTALMDTCGRPHQVFQTFDWLMIWARLYLDRRTRLSVVTGRIGGRIVLVWPLVVRKSAGLRILAAMGEPLSQYCDALIATDLGEAERDSAFAYLMELPVDVISLRRVRDDAAIGPLLRRYLGDSVERQAAPFVDVAGAQTLEAFEKRFSGKLRSSRRRRRRRLEEQGAVTFRSYGPSREAADLVATALSFKREWAARTGAPAPALRDPRFERFFVAAALSGDKAPDLRISALRCGSDVVGIAISVANKGRLYGHVLAPRPGFEAFGVGGILAEATIVSAAEQGYGSLDLLAPADTYKMEWTTSAVGVGDYSVPLGLRGDLYCRLWLRFGRRTTKAAVQMLKPVVIAFSRRLRRRER